jgi:hypothetical protein
MGLLSVAATRALPQMVPTVYTDDLYEDAFRCVIAIIELCSMIQE